MTIVFADQVSIILNRMQLSQSDETALLNEIGQIGVENTLDRFDREVSPDGIPWLKSQRANVENGQTLRDTGALKSSINHRIIGDGEVHWGTPIEYGIYNHYGARIEAKNAEFLAFKGAYGFVKVKAVDLPARPFIGFSEQDNIDVNNAIRRKLGSVYERALQ